MKRLLLTSDWHPDHVTGGVPRFHEIARSVNKLVSVALKKQVDLFVFEGDLCDPDSGLSVFRCVGLAINAALTLRRAGIPSVWIAGNHDVIEDGTGATTLTPLREVAWGLEDDMIWVFEEPGWCEAAGQRLLALPYTATSHAYDVASVIEGFRATHNRADVIAGHLAIPGIQPGEETTDMARGREVVFPLDVARRLYPHALLTNGHYHRQQVFEGVHVPGSLARLTFGERDHDPGYMLVEVR